MGLPLPIVNKPLCAAISATYNAHLVLDCLILHVQLYGCRASPKPLKKIDHLKLSSSRLAGEISRTKVRLFLQEEIFINAVQLENLARPNAYATFDHQINQPQTINSNDPCVDRFQIV